MTLSQLSPGVVIREIDNSTVTTVSNPAFGAIVGAFERGPINEIRIINTEEQLKQVFGKPNDSNYETWFAAAQYILYGGSIKVIRTDATTVRNSVSNGSAVKIDNYQDYETNHATGQTWFFASKTPGAYANGIRVYVTDAGADQVLILDAPASGDEWEFAVGAAVSSASGASARVFKYSTYVKLNTIVGTPAAGACTIGGNSATVLAYDSDTKTIEIEFSDGYSGVLIATDTFVQGSVTAVVETVTRKLLTVTDRNSIDFVAGNDITDANSNTVNIGSVAKEYLSREVFKGLRWSSIGVRPGTSPVVAGKNGYKDELHIVVVDTKGTITGTPNTILEKFIGLSKASDAKTPNGEVNYAPEVVALKSNYIYFGDHNDTDVWSYGDNTVAPGTTASNSEFTLYKSATYSVTNPISGQSQLGLEDSSTIQYVLASGVDEYTWSATDYQTALNLLSDPEAEDIDFIIPGAMGSDDLQALAKMQAILNTIESRRDCMTFVSPKRSDVIGITDSQVITQNLTNYFSKFPSSSYMAFDSGYKYIYDAYNDVYRYIPCNGDMAGLCLTTARNADAWFSPAGFQRGVLRNAIKLAYSPNKAQRDELYSERINPIVSFPGQGIVLFGDKTALGHASAFDRINVRRLFLTIEKVIGRSAKALLFSQNDETSRSQFRNFVEPYLRNIQGRRGVTDFLVKCDNTNNTPETVDRGEFYAEIYIKPTRTINFITISFIATRTGVAFEEVAS
jgi:hypothetical protein